jgi:hypothetical protein
VSSNYISSAELARRCDVSRAAVRIAIRENRISPDKVRRSGNSVLVDADHGFSVLGHHSKRKPQTPPSPAAPAVAAPLTADGLADLLAWGAVAEKPDPAPQPDPDPWAHIPEQLRAKDGSAPFWSTYGRIAGPDDPPLSDAAFWEHVHAIVGGMLGEPLELTPKHLGDVAFHLDGAINDVTAGARWDAAQWANASAQSLLEYPEVQDGSCPHSLPELQRLAAGGLLTAELQAATDAALLAYGAVAADG